MIKIITNPTIILLASQHFDNQGLLDFAQYMHHQGNAGIDQLPTTADEAFNALFKHEGRRNEGKKSPLTDNEMLTELAGRKCYNSFGSKIGHGDNEGYIANILGAPGKIPHASVLYHAKMSFFFAGISRRMTHELIRHYVGADRSRGLSEPRIHALRRAPRTLRCASPRAQRSVSPREIQGFDGDRLL